MRILFMGTPDFAVPCLQRLIQGKQDVCAVFTQPDKPKGRGYQLAPPPVKVAAQQAGIPVYQPQSIKKDPQVLGEIRALAPQLIVVVAYGKLLPPELLEIPPLGCVNIHASLLPKYRGAGPIQWSVINGEETTGVTSMFMAQGLDTGDMILKCETPIGPDETAGELHDRLSQLGAQCLSETLRLFEAGAVPRQAQDDSQSSYAPMLQKSLGELDYARPVTELYNLIRGVSPWPGAYTYLDGKLLKVHRARPVLEATGAPGELLDSQRMLVGCQGGALEFLEVQLQGARRMSAQEFLRGKKLAAGIVLGRDTQN